MDDDGGSIHICKKWVNEITLSLFFWFFRWLHPSIMPEWRDRLYMMQLSHRRPDVLPLGSSRTARSVAVCVGDTGVCIGSDGDVFVRSHTTSENTIWCRRIYPVAVCGAKVTLHENYMELVTGYSPIGVDGGWNISENKEIVTIQGKLQDNE